MSALSAVALVALSLALPAAVSGCSSPSPSLYTARNCKSNDNPRVSANRVVTLYARNYVYAGDSPDRSQYLDQARSLIPQFFATANLIFAKDGINLQIKSLSIFDENNGVLDNASICECPDDAPIKREMEVVNSGYPKDIGVHWTEWLRTSGNPVYGGNGPYPCLPGEYCNWVQMQGDIRNFLIGQVNGRTPAVQIEQIGRTLAHELGHYFQLPHAPFTDNQNLMYDGNVLFPLRSALTTQQRDMMWTDINANPNGLFSVTCDPPVTVAPKGPESR